VGGGWGWGQHSCAGVGIEKSKGITHIFSGNKFILSAIIA
jgi:hypothetical protein